MNTTTISSLPTLEMQETRVKGGFLYEVIENGKVVAKRKSVRPYLAALIDDSKLIRHGVGRRDLLANALKTSNYKIRAIAVLNKQD